MILYHFMKKSDRFHKNTKFRQMLMLFLHFWMGQKWAYLTAQSSYQLDFLNTYNSTAWYNNYLITSKYFWVIYLLNIFDKLERGMIIHNEYVCSKIFMVGTYLCTKYLDSVNNFESFCSQVCGWIIID